MNSSFSFGIVFKISVFLFFYVLAICLMGYISHDDLVTTEKKVEILEFSYQIHNGILESRRLEKNYFLYGNDDFLHENLQSIAVTMDICRKLTLGDKSLLVGEKLRNLEQHLAGYQENINRLFHTRNKQEREALVAEIRHSGKTISDISEQVVFFEKNPVMSG